MTTLHLGPGHGTLTLHTEVEGRAARLGHALTLTIGDWAATVTVADGAPSAVTLRAVLDSLEVTEGHGGLTPLTGVDRRVIRRNALKTLQTKDHPAVTFDSSAVTATAAGYAVAGQAGIAGASGPLTAEITVTTTGTTATVRAEAVIEQTAFGVRPYSAALGSLKVVDRVVVRLALSVTVPVAGAE